MSDLNWQVVENVVAAIEKGRPGVPGMRIIQKALVSERTHPTEAREVDVLVEIPIGSRVLRVGIEVKHEDRPIDVTTLEGLGAKKAKIDLDRLCVVSTSGFTERAERDAAALGIELVTIEEFEASDWWLAPPLQIIERRQVEVLGVTLTWSRGEHDRAWLARGPAQVDRVELRDASGNTASLYDWLVHHGIAALSANGAEVLVDQAEYTAKISMKPPLALLLDGGEMPMPAVIVGRYRLHRRTENVPERRFRTPDGVEAFTTQIPNPSGKIDRRQSFRYLRRRVANI